jgi:voltage-gated potassium channel
MHEDDKTGYEKVGFLDLYASFVALYSIVLIGIGFFIHLMPEVQRMFRWVDNGICALFIFDLVKRWREEDYKIGFWRRSWIDAVACIPMMPWLRWCRAVRMIRILRIVRSGKRLHIVHTQLTKDRRVSASAVSFYIFFSMIMVCAPAILITECGEPGSNLNASGDAIWWVFETMSTVGYGDFFPVTIAGRVVGAITMSLGVAMFGAMTATVLANFSINTCKTPDDDALAALRRENEELKKRLSIPTNTTTGETKTRNDCNLA